MSTSILKVEGAAWSQSAEVEKALQGLTTSRSIVETLDLDYNHQLVTLHTEYDAPVPNFWAVYRDGETEGSKPIYLGATKSNNPRPIANVDTFEILEPLMDSGTLRPVCADTYQGGRKMWGCFEVSDSRIIRGEEFKQYLIVINDHMKPNGHVQIVSSPLRMACMNSFSHILSNSSLRFSVPVYSTSPDYIAQILENSWNKTFSDVSKRVEKLNKLRYTKEQLELILDELFPYIAEAEDGVTRHARANAAVDQEREVFLTQCMNSPDIDAYKGRMYQIYNAITDYTQHYFRTDGRTNRAFDSDYRISLIPGVDPMATTASGKVVKFLKLVDKFAQAA